MSELSKEVKSGALVNFWGVVGKISAPAFLILVNRYYGAEMFGYFITATMIIDIGMAFLTFGFKDGVLIHVSKFADDTHQHTLLYNSLANALVWTLSLSALFTGLILLAGNPLFALFYEADFARNLASVARYMIISVPFVVCYKIIISATQGLKIMKYESIINGGIRPMAILVFIILFWYISPDLTGLGLGYLTAQLTVFLVSLVVFHRNFIWNRLFDAFKSIQTDRELLDFALPQNINMTLNRFITGVDVLMLPVFGISATLVGYYAAGSMIIREVRNVKLIFSSAFAPHIVRLFDSGKSSRLSYYFSETSNWISSIVIPILLTIFLFRFELLRIIHTDFTGSTLFMVFLLPVPYFYSSFGLAGNILTMTGHSKLSLINTLVSSVVNVLLNLWLIPHLGLSGAAVASSLTMMLLSILELAETRKFTGARLYIIKIIDSHAAGFITLISLILANNYINLTALPLLQKIVAAVLMLSLYGLLLFFFRKIFGTNK